MQCYWCEQPCSVQTVAFISVNQHRSLLIPPAIKYCTESSDLSLLVVPCAKALIGTRAFESQGFLYSVRNFIQLQTLCSLTFLRANRFLLIDCDFEYGPT